MRRLPSATTPAVRREVAPGIWADSRRAAWFPEQRLLVVADLHWGYAASHRARGNLLPVWGDDELAGRLDALVADYRPAEMIWLGDVVHAAAGADGAERYLRASLVPIVLIAGNHDRHWRGRGVPAVVRGDFHFHHGDALRSLPVGTRCEVIGHHHPAAVWQDQTGTRLTLPALVAAPRRLILPAFSPWAAGGGWNDRLEPGDTLWVLAPSRIFPFPPRVSLTAAP